MKRRFTERIYQVGRNRCVDVPEALADSLAKGETHVAVVVKLAGNSVRTTLVPAGRGRYRVFLKGELREEAEVDTGDLVTLELFPDRRSREPDVPSDLAAALRGDEDARRAFEGLTTARRREFVNYLDAARTPATRRRRLVRGLELLGDEDALKRRE